VANGGYRQEVRVFTTVIYWILTTQLKAGSYAFVSWSETFQGGTGVQAVDRG
jgi:hypothetical protein